MRNMLSKAGGAVIGLGLLLALAGRNAWPEPASPGVPRYTVTKLPDDRTGSLVINNSGIVLDDSKIGTLGGTYANGFAMNDGSDIVGSSQTPNNAAIHAFLYKADKSQMVDIGTLDNGAQSEAWGVNNHREVVGFSYTNGYSGSSTFYWKDGTFTAIKPLPGDAGVSRQLCINDDGVVAAMSTSSAGTHGDLFLWRMKGGSTKVGTLPSPFDDMAQPYAINSKGEVVGSGIGSYTHPNAFEHGFLYSHGKMTDLGTLGGDWSRAYGINSSGDVVGFSNLVPGDRSTIHACLYTRGKMYDLNDLIPPDSGWVLGVAQSINDKGQIVGYGLYQGQLRNFMLSVEDADGDGIPDDWETNGGYYFDGQWYSWPASVPKPDPNHKDVYVWIDYMQASDHTERPNDATIDLIRQAFANAPVTNPDGAAGINLHVIFAMKPVTFGPEGHKIHHVNVLGTMDADGNYDFSEFAKIKDSSTFPKAWSSFCHYCLFAHEAAFTNGKPNSGITRSLILPGAQYIAGSDFIVSLGTWPSVSQNGKASGNGGTTSNQAGTFMHELGHALGLHHGGPIAESGVDQPLAQVTANFKPNYLSVMNYSFQYGLLYQGKQQLFDYSRFKLPDLDEKHLDELVGLGGGSELEDYGTKWFYGGYFQASTWHANQPINWNQDFIAGSLANLGTDVSENINGDSDASGYSLLNITYVDALGFRVTEPLRSYNDWDNLNFRTGTIGAGVAIWQPPVAQANELDIVAASDLVPPPPDGLTAQSTANGIRLAWNAVGPHKEWTYSVYRSTDGNPVVRIKQTGDSFYVDTQVRPGKTYAYYVTCTNALGTESPPSATVSVILGGGRK